jgi:predicted Zn-dependent peptidase
VQNKLSIFWVIGIISIIGLLFLSGCGRPALTVIDLPNGLNLIFKEIPNAKIITLDAWVKVGSKDENKKNSGISHFIEHLLFKGTKNLGPGEAAKKIEAVGGDFNAGTSKDYTHFYLTVPKDQLDLGLDVLFQTLLKPAFDAAELERERRVVLEEIYFRNDDPASFLYELLYQKLYAQHPYGRAVIGEVKTITNLSRSEIIEYHHQHYYPSNINLIICGDFMTDEVGDKIAKLFGSRSASSNPLTKSPVPSAPTAAKNEIYTVQKDLAQEYLALGYVGPTVKSFDSYVMDVLMTILGDGRSSRLNQGLKEEKKLVYSIDASYLTQKYEGPFVASAVLYPQKHAAAVEEILKETKKLKNEKTSRKELAKAKNIIETNFALGHESVQGAASSLGYWSTIDELEYDLGYLENIRRVSAKDLQRVAQKYLNNYVVVRLVPRTNAD